NSHSPSPPSSSIAYSLLSASSEQDHPSTSGCSSDQSARVKTQKELMSALKELKIRVPADRKGRSRSSTLAALQHALTCVKQVRANQEYYHQWAVEDNQNSSLDLSTYTIDELENITSEYTLKNTDTFSVAVSFLSGKVVYASPQAAYVLRCKADRLQGALFSRLLAPQDVSMFYSSTVPCRLPVWSACTGKAASPLDCAQEKSMFCRLSGGREREGELRYSPFRLTPYQLTLRDTDHAAPQPCCLIIAERVHSGYEAPRIPPDKRIFTTSHTPSCVFQEVDERAVPLLGYLPQDLVGTPVLLYLHPEDRPAMVAIHKKILQLAGQPLDHSPLRVCARSGEYLTIDTSWSCFVNPWSRKVAFIIGRHKVRTSPLNEDVFAPPCGGLLPSMVPEIHQLSSQIHRLLLQPVHSSSSLGYCSVGSNGSHEPYLSLASSSDSTGAPAEDTPQHQPMTFQQICKDVHMVKNHGQKVFIESRSRPPACKHTSTGVVLPRSSSQAVRPVPEAVKEAVPQPCVLDLEERKELPSPYSYQQINCLDSIIRYLDSCNVPSPVKRKCGSSSNSDDDKHPSRAEAQAAGKDTPTHSRTLTDTLTQICPVLSCPVRLLHTQQEELAFLQRFRELSQLRVFEPQGNPNQRRHSGAPHSKGEQGMMERRERGEKGGKRWRYGGGEGVAQHPPGGERDPAGAPGPAATGHTHSGSWVRVQCDSRMQPLRSCNSNPPVPIPVPPQVEAIDCSNQDTMSTSSDLLDLLLQEDARSGTGSAASGSGSLGSGSNGCSTSGSGTRSSQSSHTSKYFGSVDSSENDLVGKKRVGQDSDQFIKYVLQDPIWLLMANTDEKVMMTYQLPSRDRAAVLRSDREALRAMQKQQPRFSEEQKRELSEVHPWIRTGQLPRAINITVSLTHTDTHTETHTYTVRSINIWT
ncbi:PER1 protein, partial [Amia calva]|nr:PER1 protein [Amia calva]